MRATGAGLAGREVLGNDDDHVEDVPMLLVRLESGFRALRAENVALKRELAMMSQYNETLQKRVVELVRRRRLADVRAGSRMLAQWWLL